VTWSNGFCGGRGKRGAMVEKGKGAWQSIVVIIKFDYFCGGEEKMKTRTKGWSNLDFSYFPFSSIYLKN
jgi:hypothetical protein